MVEYYRKNGRVVTDPCSPVPNEITPPSLPPSVADNSVSRPDKRLSPRSFQCYDNLAITNREKVREREGERGDTASPRSSANLRFKIFIVARVAERRSGAPERYRRCTIIITPRPSLKINHDSSILASIPIPLSLSLFERKNWMKG